MLVFVHEPSEGGIERIMESCRETGLLPWLHDVVRLHDEGTEGRGQGEGVQKGYTHCYCHRKSELLVERTCRSTHEAGRNEHRHEDECRGYKGCGYASHRIHGRLV